MADKYKVIITPQAQQHLKGIRDYILYELKSPIAAKNTLLLLKTEIESLEIMPNRFPKADEIIQNENGIHKMTVKNFLIYFTVDENESTVNVFAVIYARRDQKTALQS